MSTPRSETIEARAAIAREPGAELQVEAVQLRAIEPHEVLVKNKASGLCHTDLSVRQGEVGLPFPIIPGHEGSGVVLAVGSDVTLVTEGDHVIVAMMAECGVCRACRSDRTSSCETTVPLMGDPAFRQNGEPLMSMAFGAAFATHSIVPETALVPLPRDIPFEAAALFGCGVSTGVGAVRNKARVEAGSSVVVFGLGSIGLNVVQACRLAGAARIIALDGIAVRRELGTRFGATDVLDPAELGDDVVGRLVEMTGGGADYVFECVGKATVLQDAVTVAHPFGGTCVAVGAIPFGDTISVGGGTFLWGRSVLGTFVGDVKPRTGMPLLVDEYQRDLLNVDDLVTRRISLDDINEGFRGMEAGEGIRTVLIHD